MKFRRMLGLALVLSGLSSASLFAKVCVLDISGNDQMKFDKKELVVEKDCTEIKVQLAHSGKLPKTAMGHNWVLVKSADMTAVSGDAVKAGPSKDYIPAKDKRIIAHTKLIGGGEKTDVTFKKSELKAGEAYTYFCSFPGHFGLMQGKLIVK